VNLAITIAILLVIARSVLAIVLVEFEIVMEFETRFILVIVDIDMNRVIEMIEYLLKQTEEELLITIAISRVIE